jgi:hypothetical protein
MSHQPSHQRPLRLTFLTSLGLARLLKSMAKSLAALWPTLRLQNSCKDTRETPSSGRKSRKFRSESTPSLRQEPPLSLGHLRHSPLPRSLNELSQPQLELALSVVHNQMHKPLHNSPFLVVWEPPQELSHLPQSEWLCLIEVWEQLLNQRRRNPLQ